MIFSGDDSSSFTHRMADFGQNIEEKIEGRAEELSDRANNLCQLVESIDEVEQELKENIKALSSIDVVTFEQSEQQRI